MILLHKRFTLILMLLILNGPGLVHYQESQIPEQKLMAIKVDRQDEGSLITSVSFEYGLNNEFGMKFQPSGPNRLTGLDVIYTIDWKRGQREEILKSCTDWIGPLIVRKLESTNLAPAMFTGGWHTVPIETEDIKTAIPKSTVVLVDGKIVQNSYFGRGNEVKILVTNDIYGYNSDFSNVNDAAIREYVEYTITANKIDVQVSLTALQNVEIEKYYGLQSQNSAWKGELIYRSSQGEYELKVDSSISSDSLLADKYGVDTVIVRNDEHTIRMWLDTGYGLGQLMYKSGDKPRSFTRDYGKSYFNLINGTNAVLNKDDTLTWRGAYTFLPSK